MIHRFEYSTEAFWKYLKAYLLIEHNLPTNSPREVIRSGLKAKFYDEESSKELLQMLDDRNLTSHTYVEELAESIAGRIPAYSKIM
jgi:nucleotidyltransferase substrate binding protein (TIGR01987 family)